jgi:DNA-binding response OmpR family regulator/DNA-binding MarR family transcriptional regulator
VQPADARTHVEATRSQILVIDDDPTTLELVRSVLEANGYRCLSASSGEEALSLIRATPGILLAISDINMPGLDGIAVLRNLAAQTLSHPAPRVIFLTAYPSIDFAVAALRLGALDFLIKPVRPQSLLRAVREAVERVNRERSAQATSSLAQQAEALAAALKDWAHLQRHEVASATWPAAAHAQPCDPKAGLHAGEFALLGMDHLRRLRRLFPPLGELDDVAWDLLRELLRAERNGQRLSVSALTLSVEQVSSTTALRRTQELVKAGHIVRNPDPSDARRDFVALAPDIRDALDRYLQRVAAELAAAAGSSTPVK